MHSGDSFTHHARTIMRYVPFNYVFTYSVKLQACYVARYVIIAKLLLLYPKYLYI